MPPARGRTPCRLDAAAPPARGRVPHCLHWAAPTTAACRLTRTPPSQLLLRKRPPEAARHCAPPLSAQSHVLEASRCPLHACRQAARSKKKKGRWLQATRPYTTDVRHRYRRTVQESPHGSAMATRRHTDAPLPALHEATAAHRLYRAAARRHLSTASMGPSCHRAAPPRFPHETRHHRPPHARPPRVVPPGAASCTPLVHTRYVAHLRPPMTHRAPTVPKLASSHAKNGP